MSAEQSRPLPDRFRFASGDRTHSGEELAPTLQARLRLIAIVIVVAMLAIFALLSSRISAAEVSVRASMERGRMVIGLLAPLGTAVVWWLRASRSRSVAVLRWIEVGMLVGFSALIGLGMIVDFPSFAPVLDRAPLDLGLSQSAWMSLMIVAYGLLIPNRWQRTLWMIAAMLGVVVVVDVWSLSQFSLPVSVVATYLIAQWTMLLGFTTFAVIGAYRIDVARTVARDALRLGQYVLLEPLGAGGMGEVYRAEHRMLRRPCAVKLIRPEQAGDPDALRRFEREVQTTATLTHPNTIAIYDYGIADDGTFYYVMEYLPGETLEQLVAREGPMPAARAVHVLRQIAGALQEAHDAGLTHRDIKPGNVMLGERGGNTDVAKLLDFGLVAVRHSAEALDEAAEEPHDLMIVGTPSYMSPEQCAGEGQPGPASDLYSLGALGFFLVTGRPPFDGHGELALMMAHLNEAPPSARALRPEITEPLDTILLRCLSKHPEDRFRSARAMEQELAKLTRM